MRKRAHLHFLFLRSKETTGWVIGPEPFEKLTYYAIARCPDAKTPDQVLTWVCRLLNALRVISLSFMNSRLNFKEEWRFKKLKKEFILILAMTQSIE